MKCVVVCCSVLQCVAVCCCVLQCVAVWCSVVQCGAECCSMRTLAVCTGLNELLNFSKLSSLQNVLTIYKDCETDF